MEKVDRVEYPDNCEDEEPQEIQIPRWKCSNNHIIVGTPFVMAVNDIEGQPSIVLETCPFCYVQWVKSHTPEITRIGDYTG